jgi:hypothetical protein
MPTAFISYSWDDPGHTEVKALATRLRRDGIDVKLDQWELQPGYQLSLFMERAVRDNDFVIVVCTPKYKARSDRRQGGGGYEGDIMTAEILTSGNRATFIPLHRGGSWKEAAPSWLLGRLYLDFKPESDSDQSYIVLLRTLHGKGVAPPPLGPELHLGQAEWEQARALLKESQVKDHSASIAELLKQAIEVLSNKVPK